ncbi:MAG: molybdate ABC transporter substrate-binding protein, partial [Chloroflexota bacterium]|nr:molybdate ABC transporter substrate-binding protein [Chloroflexota bacterium]
MTRSSAALAALLLIAAALPACAGDDGRPEVIVGAAASLEPLLRDAEADLEASANVEITYVFGASGALAEQVRQGAPIHLFLSASESFAQRLAPEHAAPGSVRPFAVGRLAFVTTLDASPHADWRDLAADARVRHVAVANPEVAPYGAAAMAALDEAGLRATVEERLVVGGNAAQTLQLAASGNAHAAIVPLSLARADLAEGLTVLPMGAAGAEHLVHALALIDGASPQAAAVADLLTAPQVAARLERYGYAPLPAGSGAGRPAPRRGAWGGPPTTKIPAKPGN